MFDLDMRFEVEERFPVTRRPRPPVRPPMMVWVYLSFAPGKPVGRSDSSSLIWGLVGADSSGQRSESASEAWVM